jgi:hypothetical protein
MHREVVLPSVDHRPSAKLPCRRGPDVSVLEIRPHSGEEEREGGHMEESTTMAPPLTRTTAGTTLRCIPVLRTSTLLDHLAHVAHLQH